MRAALPGRLGRPLVALGLALASLAGAGCGGPDQAVLVAGKKLDASEIDRDPVAVLPGGMVAFATLDGPAMFQSAYGGDVAGLLANVLPLGAESNFVPSRDVQRVIGGAYSMQGADFCAVVSGNFDVDAIARAAAARTPTVAGVPMVRSRYAESDLYTVGNLGFTVITPHTVLSGNETGIRRALDRLRFGKLERSVPTWMLDLAKTPGAAFTIAGDLGTQVVAEATVRQVPFVAGMKLVRVVGNFQPPGVNVAGTMTYADADAAGRAAPTLKNLQQLAQMASLFTSWGWGAVPNPQIQQQGADVAFTMPVEDAFVHTMLRMATDSTKPRAGG
jgi:hypothetical protein